MNTYRVWFTVTGGGYADVVANTLEEAIKKSSDLEPSDYNSCDDADWEVDLATTEIENAIKE